MCDMSTFEKRLVMKKCLVSTRKNENIQKTFFVSTFLDKYKQPNEIPPNSRTKYSQTAE